MEKEKTDICYGDGYINVYLPREDGVNHSNVVTTPSPIFTIDSIYKFSDQVLNDRHLFISNKTMHPTQFDCDEVNSSIELNSGRSSVMTESPLNTIKLSLDASRQGQTFRPRRRFNERLSAYMSSNRKTSENIKLKEYSKSARTPRTNREIKMEKVRKNILSPVITLGRPGRGASYEKTINSRNLELPPLQTARTTLTRQKSYFGKEDTFWFPSSALKGIESKQNLPLRPSSRQFNVWKQSTELQLENQNDRFSPARLTWPHHISHDIYITQKTFV